MICRKLVGFAGQVNPSAKGAMQAASAEGNAAMLTDSRPFGSKQALCSVAPLSTSSPLLVKPRQRLRDKSHGVHHKWPSHLPRHS